MKIFEKNGNNSALSREALVNLGKLSNNIVTLKKIIAPAKIMAVVKADAYGHGMVQIASSAVECGVTDFGVANLEEALILRSNGISGNILAWLHAPDIDFVPAIENRISIGISSVAELRRVVVAAKSVSKVAQIHIKVDTGMCRNGVVLSELGVLLDQVWEAVQKKWVILEGMFSHFAVADDGENVANRVALDNFCVAIEKVSVKGFKDLILHIANSAAVWNISGSAFDMARIGLGLYGLSPFSDRDPVVLGLDPIMTLRARVISVKTVSAGTGVSYGFTYVTGRKTSLALIAVGYADGIPRAASNRGEVFIRGRRYRVAGIIAMDQFVVDLGEPVTDVVAGDWAIIFGSGVGGEPTVRDWALAAGTIDYEVISRLSFARIARRYILGS